jgi:hypothetical protein
MFLIVIGMAFWGSVCVSKPKAGELSVWRQTADSLTGIFRELVRWRARQTRERRSSTPSFQDNGSGVSDDDKDVDDEAPAPARRGRKRGRSVPARERSPPADSAAAMSALQPARSAKRPRPTVGRKKKAKSKYVSFC